MAEVAWQIADWKVEVRAAVEYLMRDYPWLTLLHYDCGGESRRDKITMSDLGRATLFGAFRGWQAAASLMHAADATNWPSGDSDWNLAAAPWADHAEWLSRKDVREARALFSSLARGDSGGWREAATSKILHLKWPEFFPIIDGQLRTLYSESAMKAERRIPASRRRSHASTTGYWLAVRQDLLRANNQEADEATRASLMSEQGRNPDKVARLTGLSRLRLLDALAWAVASAKLPTVPTPAT